MASAKTQSLEGVYQLTGVMETASGFQLHADSTFEFYFSYGALDRYGSGRWKLDGNNIILNSKRWQGKDFRLMKSSRQDIKEITTAIVAANTMLLSYVHFAVYSNGEVIRVKTNSRGIANFNVTHIDSLAVQFEFCPERTSIFDKLPTGHNYFEFTFEPWLAEVFFQNFVLEIGDKQLTGTHPLLAADKKYTYLRE